MKLSYVDILGDGKRRPITATITTDHPLSSYDQPVLLLEDGHPLNAESWILMAYQVVKASQTELDLLKRWVGLINLFAGNPHAAAVAIGSKGGRANTEKQNLARAANAKRGGRPKGSKNKPKDSPA